VSTPLPARAAPAPAGHTLTGAIYFSVMQSAPKPCGHPGCGVLVRDGTNRCPKHIKVAWSKPVTTKRVTGRKLQALRSELFARNPLCVTCDAQGRVSLATQRDHIVPLAEGGADDDSNVQGLCEECHDRKSKVERVRGQARAWSRYGGGSLNLWPPTPETDRFP